MAPNPEPPAAELPASLVDRDTSLVDLVDRLLGRGVVVDGEVVLGLAGIDLIYLRLAALLAAADRIRRGATGSPEEMPPGAPTQAREDAEREEAPAAAAAAREGFELADLPDVEHETAAVHVRPARGESVTVSAGGAAAAPARWNPDPEEVRKGVMRLVLALAEFIRQLLERQAIRRMEAGTLSADETERLGTALSQLEETLRELAERAGLDPAEINLDLGPLGKLV